MDEVLAQVGTRSRQERRDDAGQWGRELYRHHVQQGHSHGPKHAGHPPSIHQHVDRRLAALAAVVELLAADSRRIAPLKPQASPEDVAEARWLGEGPVILVPGRALEVGLEEELVEVATSQDPIALVAVEADARAGGVEPDERPGEQRQGDQGVKDGSP